MSSVYDSMALKTVANQSQSAVGAPIILDAWFEEGDITVNAAKTISRGGAMLDRPLYSWAARVDYADDPTAPDFVTLVDNNANYTYDLLQGKPMLVLKGIASGNPIVGVLGSDLLGPICIPQSTIAANSIEKRVAGKFLRHGQVTLFALAYYPVPVNATTDIAVGDRLLYDESDKLWVKDASLASPVIACHAATEASGQYVGALFLGCPLTQA